MPVLHIRDLLLRFIGIIVDLRSLIRLVRLIHFAMLFALMFVVMFVVMFILIQFIRLLPLLVHVLVLFVALLGLLWFVFLLAHTVFFRPLRILLPCITAKKSCHATSPAHPTKIDV
jgi:hypothetical protein